MSEIEARRPTVVDAAVAILAILLVVGFFRSIAHLDTVAMHISPAMAMVLMLVATGLSGVLLGLIADGRNWARIVYLAMVLYGIIMTITIGTAVQQAPVDVAIRIATHTTNLIAIVLLFTPASNAWFRQVHELRARATN
jgi:hypothetical protein